MEDARMLKKNRSWILASALLTAMAAGSLSAEPVTIKYTLWDANQLPAYQKVADDFMAKNPDIKIVIDQAGWNDYWTGLQTSMVGGTAPDVFTDHLAKVSDFVGKGQLVDLAPLVARDKVDTSVYLPGLADLWTKAGKRYGLPKDWDTIAVVVNKDIQKEAGVTDAELAGLTWNPKDGGTFQKVLAKLTLDKNGNNGLAANFDPKNVVRYGMEIQHSDDRGQSQFSSFALSTGWYYTDGTFKANYHFDDPRFIQTIQWMLDMTKKGFICPYDVTALSSSSLFPAKKAGATLDGSWMIGYYANSVDFPVAFVQTPIGPVGRKSMTNGLADSIWIGSKHKEEAWKWVKYLASAEAETVVGSFGVVFPAVKAGVDNALAAYKAKKLDVSAFTDMATGKGVTFVYPVLDNGIKVQEIMTQAFDTIFLGKGEVAATLKAANAKVNALFK
jgi:multiple sugar transport system substrate-binding protein